MSASIQPPSDAKRTYWTRQYVFACNHTTVRHCSVKPSAMAAATPAPATAAVPFLMPVRVSHDCVACVRHKLVVRLEDKTKAVRSTFTLLCHSLDAIVKDTEKHRRSKSKFADAVKRPGDDNNKNDDNDNSFRVEQDENWDDQPLPLASLRPIYNTHTVCASSSEEDAHLRLSEKIHELREVLERCKNSRGEAAPSGGNGGDDAGVDAEEKTKP
ncbi:MAG: RFC checkpoint protein Rad17 [Sporothrix thermara]